MQFHRNSLSVFIKIDIVVLNTNRTLLTKNPKITVTKNPKIITVTKKPD